MTSLAEERAEQARWKLRPRFSGVEVFDLLVENEFAPPEQVAAEEARELRAVVEFAVATVPYYRALFAGLGLAVRDIRDRRDLPRLPILGRRDLQDGFESLKPARLPPGTEIAGVVHSSGSTGPPTQVVFSVESNLMFSYLNQRQLRWFRRDPARTLATLRSPPYMPQPEPGRFLANGESLRAARWTHVGVFFETGANVYFSLENPLEAQLEWLRRERPDYLLSGSRALEHLGMTAAGARPCESLLGLTAISDVLTPAARRDLEAAYGAPVQLGYGLNEVGLVAGRCEADRYHVHREHCLVEIVEADGMPTPPGRAGRLLVTALRNQAMPLIRYDTNDLVVALAGPCPCGRTLPSFGEVLGRWSRIAPLPSGTLGRVDALFAAVRGAPPALRRNLRRYQAYQFRGGDFELRMETAGALPPALDAYIGRAWRLATGETGPRLAIREVQEIPRHVDKFVDFVSEFSEPVQPAEISR